MGASTLPSHSAAVAELHVMAGALVGKDGRVLVRWSGTEAKLRVMIEGPNPDKIRRMADGIAAEAKRDIG